MSWRRPESMLHNCLKDIQTTQAGIPVVGIMRSRSVDNNRRFQWWPDSHRIHYPMKLAICLTFVAEVSSRLGYHLETGFIVWKLRWEQRTDVLLFWIMSAIFPGPKASCGPLHQSSSTCWRQLQPDKDQLADATICWLDCIGMEGRMLNHV